MKLRFPYLGLFSFLFAFAGISPHYASAQDLSDQVIIRRTAYGVPHIKADNMHAAGFALAYVQLIS